MEATEPPILLLRNGKTYIPSWVLEGFSNGGERYGTKPKEKLHFSH